MNAAWIDRPGALTPPRDDNVVGLDTEFMRRNTYYPKLALVQAAHADRRWLIDPLAYDAGTDMRALVSGHCCVMHSAGEDLEALAPLLDDAPMRLFDTQIAAALCGMGPGLSYQKLVAQLLDVEIPKDETRSDWLQRPLSSSQLEYAEQDVAYLAPLHARLAAELETRGRDQWHAQDCARLVQRARDRQDHVDAQPQRALSAAADWPPEVQARLRRILLWRESAARKLDKPKPWILDDAHALSLAQQPPRNAHGLFERTRGQRALRGPERSELLRLLHARATPEELAELEPIPPTPRGSTRHAVDAMRKTVRTVATELDLPPGLLCPRRLVEQFAVTRKWPDELQGWRADLLQAELTAQLPD